MDESAHKPTIKGMFVKSHVDAVRELKGDDGVRRLEELFGKPVMFTNSQDVYVSDEVKLIECAYDVLDGSAQGAETRSFEAGKLHFRNFTKTPFGKIIFSVFRPNFKQMMLQSSTIAGHVFRGVKFTSEDLGKTSVAVTTDNNDYPIEHFRGLFSEWMQYAGLHGTVTAQEPSPGQYRYEMTWEEPHE